MLDAIFAGFEFGQGCLARVALHQQLISEHLHLLQSGFLLSRVFFLFRAQLRLQMTDLAAHVQRTRPQDALAGA